MTVQSVIDILNQEEKKYLLKMSSASIAKRLKVPVQLIISARTKMKNSKQQPPSSKKEGQIIYKEQIDNSNDVKEIRFSKIAPTKKSVEELFEIDGITTKLDHFWAKSVEGGYHISAKIKVLVEDTSYQDLLNSLTKTLKLPVGKVIKSNAKKVDELLVISISDDHVGIADKCNLFGSKNTMSYKDRLSYIRDQVISLNKKYEKLVILRLGDELDGWNGETTRGGHNLNSASNATQFDGYVEANKSFYDTLFSSDVASDITIYCMNNSNHSGKGLSYIANRALEIYLNAAWPFVETVHSNRFIDHFEWNNHVISFTHGKDDTHRKKAFPFRIDKETDLYLCQYFDSFDYSLSKTNITLFKGDLHQLSFERAKFGFYINCPSIANSSDHSEHNYGKGSPGALLSIFSDKPTPNLIPLDF